GPNGAGRIGTTANRTRRQRLIRGVGRVLCVSRVTSPGFEQNLLATPAFVKRRSRRPAPPPPTASVPPRLPPAIRRPPSGPHRGHPRWRRRVPRRAPGTLAIAPSAGRAAPEGRPERRRHGGPPAALLASAPATTPAIARCVPEPPSTCSRTCSS